MSQDPVAHAPGRSARAFWAGVLCANSLPHLVCAAAGRRMLTPLGGPQSSPLINALWGGANLAAGLLLLNGAGRRARPRLKAFVTGAALFALWAVTAEKVLRLNG